SAHRTTRPPQRNRHPRGGKPMIFEAELAQARYRQRGLANQLAELTAARARITDLRAVYLRYLEEFEGWLAIARGTHEAQYLPILLVTPREWFVDEYLIAPHDHRRIQQARDDWTRAIARLADLQEKLDRKIRELQERKYRLDLWIV